MSTVPLNPPDATADFQWLQHVVAPYVEIYDITAGAMGGRAFRVRGRLRVPSAVLYAQLAPILRAQGYTLLLRREKDEPVLLVLQGVIRPTPNNRWLPPLLLVLTVISMLFTYTILYATPELTWTSILRNLSRGWEFTLSLLAILLAHELGHYFTAKHFGVAVTLPYLIPFPLNPFGTMGAVIRMKDLPPNKRAMLLTGAAGPLAGLVVALPILIWGLRLSPVTPLPPEGGYSLEGNSILYAAIKYLLFGRLLPSGGEDVLLHPIAYAGWAGLLVTSLNLFPAGQLDGGHVAYALLGDRARYLTWGVIVITLVLGFWWPGWFLWSALAFIFSRREARPLDDVSPLTRREVGLAVLLLVIFVLIFTPLPLRFV